jgi:hypothetical protein
MSVEHLCRCDVCRAKVERMTVTTEIGEGTELATERLRKLATKIAHRMYEPSSLTAGVEGIIFDELRQAAFDTFREGIILADQSVVEQLAIALSTIEELEEACDFHIRACELNDGRVRDLTRKVEDLANDRAAADAEAVKLREENTGLRGDVKRAEAGYDSVMKANGDICSANRSYERENTQLRRQLEDEQKVRKDLDRRIAAIEQIPRIATELEGRR